MKYARLLLVCWVGLGLITGCSAEDVVAPESDASVFADVLLPDVPEIEEDTASPEVVLPDVTLSFEAPLNGETVTGLVPIEVHAFSVSGVIELSIVKPEGLTDQMPDDDVFRALWNTDDVPDGPFEITARAVDGQDREATVSITVTIAHGTTGTLSGRADSVLWDAAGLSVSVAQFDNLIVGAPLGAGTVGEDGRFDVSLALPAPDARVVITLGDDLARTSVVLEGGAAEEVVISALSTLWVDLAGVYKLQSGDADDALAQSRARLNEHLQRPDVVDSVGAAAGVGSPATASTNAGLTEYGLLFMAETAGESGGAVLDALRRDLADGIFDGTTAGESIATPKGWVPTVETTRYDLAAAIFAQLQAGVINVALDPQAIAADGALLADISTDDGPLYPETPPPTAFEAYPPTVQFADPTPAEGSFHNAPFQAVIVAANADETQILVNGTATPGTSVLVDPATLDDGPIVIEGQATSDMGTTVSVSRTVFADTTGPEISVQAPAADAVLLDNEFTLSATAIDVGVGSDTVTLFLPGNFEFWGSDLEESPTFDVPMTLSGPKVVTIRAWDLLGNMSEADWAILVDTIGPALTVDSPQSGAIGSDADLVVSGTAVDVVHTAVAVSGTNGQQGWSADVAEDGTWSMTVSLEEGLNSLTFTAEDSVGLDGPSVPLSAILDSTGPDVTLTAPGTWSAAGPVTVAGTVTDAWSELGSVSVDGIDTSLDEGAFSQATTAYEQHQAELALDVVVIDSLGNVSTVQAMTTIDAEPPTLMAASSIPDWVGPGSGALEIVVAAFEIGESGVAAVNTLEGLSVVFLGDDQWAVDLPLGDTVNTASFEGVDNVGNVSEVLAFSVPVDSTPPVVTVDAPEPLWIKAGVDSVTLTGTVTEAESGVASLEMDCDNDQDEIFTPGTVDGTTWTLTHPLSGHTWCLVRAFDAVGNKSANVFQQIDWDGTAPSVTLTAPTAGQWVGPGSLTIAGQLADTQAGPHSIIVGAGLAGGGVEQVVGADPFATSLEIPAVHGLLEIALTTADVLGNEQTTAVSVQVDATGPATALSPAGLLINDTWWYGVASQELTCTAIDADQAGATACLGAECGPDAITVAVPLGAPADVVCSGSDMFGNTGQTTTSVAADLEPPALTLVGATEGFLTNQTALSVSGTWAEALTELDTLTLSVNGVDVVATMGDGVFSAALILPEGPVVIEVAATDVLGNAASASLSGTVDLTPPAIEWLARTSDDESLYALSLVDGTPQLSGSHPVALGPQCTGNCLIRKYVHRWTDTNIPTPAVSAPDAVAIDYVLMDGATALTDPHWPVADGDDWALPLTFDVFGVADASGWTYDDIPSHILVSVTDAAGNTATSTLGLDVQLLTPPVFTTVVPSPAPDGTDLSEYTLDGANLHQIFTGAPAPRLMALTVVNPWPVELDVQALGGDLRMVGTVRRPWLADTGQASCAADSCGDGQCQETFEDAAPACGSGVNASDATIVSDDVALIQTVPADAGGQEVPKGNQEFFKMPAETTYSLTLRGAVSNGLCAVAGPSDLSYTAPATSFPFPLPPLDKQVTAYQWLDDGHCHTDPSDTGTAHCSLLGQCGGQPSGATYQRPPLLRTLTIQSGLEPLLRMRSELIGTPATGHIELLPQGFVYTTESTAVGALPTSPYAPF